MDFKSRLLGTVKKHKLFRSNDAVVLGFSGGPDSVFCASIIKDVFPKLKIHLVYFDHALRSEKSLRKEKQFVRNFAKKHCLGLTILKLPVLALVKSRKLSVEAAGHLLRQGALVKFAKDNACKSVILAHHGDDLVETFLLKLLRGSESRLTGLRPVIHREGIRFVRPLLDFDKSDILAYLKKKNQAYSIDETNQDLRFFRNRLRLQLIPHLETQFSEFKPLIKEASAQFEALEIYLDQFFEPYLKKMAFMKNGGLAYPLTAFEAMPTFLRPYFILRLLEKALGYSHEANRVQIEAISRAISLKGFRQISLPKGFVAKLDGHSLQLVLASHKSLAYEVSFDTFPFRYVLPDELGAISGRFLKSGEGPSFFASNIAYLAWDKPIGSELWIRSPKAGDIIHRIGAQTAQQLSRFFVSQKVPKLKRDQWPLVGSGEQILWVSGQAVALCVKVIPTTKKILRLEWHH